MSRHHRENPDQPMHGNEFDNSVRDDDPNDDPILSGFPEPKTTNPPFGIPFWIVPNTPQAPDVPNPLPTTPEPSKDA